jgi:hypothetical protein
MDDQIADAANAPIIFFHNMGSLEMWLRVPPAPASFPAPSAKIFIQYLEHFAPKLLDATDDRF